MRLVRCDNSHTVCWVSVCWLLSFWNDREWARTGGLQHVEEESEGPNLPPHCPLILALFLLSFTVALMFYSESVAAGAFRLADRRPSYMWILFHVQHCMHNCLCTDTTMVPTPFSTQIQCHIHEVITGTDTHILALSLVEPLNGVPLTAIQSQSLLAKNR